MIKLFRHIRRSLIQKNQMGKYFKYAIGEIVLVMVGILLALQINNWNENQKLKTLKKGYLQSLLADLEVDSLNIKNRIAFAVDRIAEYEAYEAKFNTSNMTSGEIIGGLVGISAETNTLTFKTNTIKVLISTGDIKLIPNALKNRIIDLNRSQEFLDIIIKRNNSAFINQIQEIGKLGWSPPAGRLYSNLNIGKLAQKHMANDEKVIELIFAVESAYNYKYTIEKMVKEEYEALLIEIAEVNELIKSELN